MPCLQVYLMVGVAVMNSIAACIQEWPTEYQMINVPHFLMYIAIVYYLCKKEFYNVAWVLLGLITLVSVDFIIFAKKIFAMEHTVMNRLKGSVPSTPCGCKSTSPGGASPPIGPVMGPALSTASPTPPPVGPYAKQPQASHQISQFTSQPSAAYTLEPGQAIRSQLEADGMQYTDNQIALPIPINTAAIKPPANTSK
jgi:hypothetical protein